MLLSGPTLAGSAWKPTVDVYARETLLAYQPQTVVDTRTFPVAEQNSFSLGVRVRQLLFDSAGRTRRSARQPSMSTPRSWRRPWPEIVQRCASS